MSADPSDGSTAALAPVRRAILRIAEQRDAAQRGYGIAVVDTAHLQRMLRDQGDHLERSLREIERARQLAGTAGEQARAEGADVIPYERTQTELARQADLLRSAQRQLADAEAACRGNAAHARRLFEENLRRLDASLGEQLSLLVRLEELDRQRGIAMARRRQGWQVGHQ